jgi:hypothetical protein
MPHNTAGSLSIGLSASRQIAGAERLYSTDRCRQSAREPIAAGIGVEDVEIFCAGGGMLMVWGCAAFRVSDFHRRKSGIFTRRPEYDSDSGFSTWGSNPSLPAIYSHSQNTRTGSDPKRIQVMKTASLYSILGVFISAMSLSTMSCMCGHLPREALIGTGLGCALGTCGFVLNKNPAISPRVMFAGSFILTTVVLLKNLHNVLVSGHNPILP